MLSPAHARAVALALLGFSAFACGDATNKWLTAHYGAFQIMATQSALAIPLLLAAAPFLGGARSALSAAHWTLHLARAGLYVLVVTMVLFAFARLPLATFYTAVFTTPLVAALLSMVLYGERPCLRRWAAIAGGFAGVLLAFRPGLAEIPGGWAPWVVLAATVPIAMLQISARAMPRASALTLGLWPMVGGALGGSLLAWHGGGVAWVEPAHWPLFALGAVCIATGDGLPGPGVPVRADRPRRAVPLLPDDLGRGAGLARVRGPARRVDDGRGGGDRGQRSGAHLDRARRSRVRKLNPSRSSRAVSAHCVASSSGKKVSPLTERCTRVRYILSARGRARA